MLDLELFDETLDINSTANYELSVQLVPDGLSYCIRDTIRNKFVLIRVLVPEGQRLFTSETLAETIGHDDFLLKTYRKVSLVTPSPAFTLVPLPLFDPAYKEQYFRLNHSAGENINIFSNRIKEPDAIAVFSVPGFISDTARKFFARADINHHSKPLLEQIAHNTRNQGGLYIHVHFENDFFNLIMVEHNILKFINSFTYRNVSDVLYHILNTFNTLSTSREEILHVSGMTERYDDLHSGLSMYLKNIEFAAPSGNFTFSYVFNDIDLHRYINLFTVSSCE